MAERIKVYSEEGTLKMFGKEEKQMNAQKIFLNEDEPTQDAAFKFLDEVRDGDVYGWGTFFAWKDLERIYGSVNK